MAGPIGLRSEVFSALHDPGTEETFPGAIGPDSGRKRIVRSDEPLSKSEPISRESLGEWRQSCRNSAFDFVTDAIVLPADQYVRVTGLISFLHDHHDRQTFLKGGDSLFRLFDRRHGLLRFNIAVAQKIASHFFVLGRAALL